MPATKCGPPETIYLQCYDENGNLLDWVHDDVTWCRDQINDNDAVYILATSELAELRERLADYARQAAHAAKGYPDDVDEAYRDEEAVRILVTRTKGGSG